MARKRRIPDSDHVARYCSPRGVASDGRITSAAFELRPRDEGRASVSWLECSGAGSHAARLTETLATLRSTILGYQESGRVAVMRAGLLRTLSTAANTVEVVHKPSSKNRCHSVILGLLDDLAREGAANLANRGEVYLAVIQVSSRS